MKENKSLLEQSWSNNENQMKTTGKNDVIFAFCYFSSQIFLTSSKTVSSR